MYQKKPLMLLFCSTFASPFIMGQTAETTNNQQPTTNNQQPTKIYCPKLLFMATIINRFLPLKRSLLTR
ncbi:TPA: hypothetical protein ACPO1X_000565 [Haemophilus influenzae]|uniref:hypothetical protein n=1 Tax=uncultured Haemophilus sp. TaxID=237779 RepID=UPI001EDD77A3|nr:hypothetical protein [Haemophilus influenzae]MCK9147235.1 hypothetical protein [Haemophilus influenzae]